jgi:hypothetical protein
VAKPLCRDALIADMPAVAIISVGTRGDVQPCIALALQLKAKGQPASTRVASASVSF